MPEEQPSTSSTSQSAEALVEDTRVAQPVIVANVKEKAVTMTRPTRAKRTRSAGETTPSSSTKTRSKKKPPTAGAGSDQGQEKEKPKRAPRAKKTAGTTPRPQRKPAPATEAAREVQEERTFEPELDATPVKPRKALFSDIAVSVHAERDEIEAEASPFEMEDTLKRPAVLAPIEPTSPIVPAMPEVPETPNPVSTNGYHTFTTDADLDDDLLTPDLDATQAFPKIIDTPPPTFDEPEELVLEILEVPEPFTAMGEHEQEQVASSVAVMERLEVTTAIEVQVEVEELHVPQRPRIVWQLSRGRSAALLLLVLALCIIPLWRDTHDAHLYLYTLNALNGQAQGQQDLGGGYTGVSALSGPALSQSSLLVGLESEQTGQQRVLMLSNNGTGSTTWNVARTIDAPTTRATLSIAPGGQLVVSYASGLQVLNRDGSVLWQTTEEAPALGAHAFAPAFDSTTLYTVNSAQNGVIAAYNLRDGSLRWTQRLDDTLNYAPPLLMYGNLLYIAADHVLYALNQASGLVQWQAQMPARTLLMNSVGQPQLIAVGANGIQSLDPLNGHPSWSFDGHPNAAASNGASLTNAQFYEAGLSSASQVIFATGIVWDADQVRQQLWLFAIDAASGTARWSERVGATPASADAGRVLAPYIDASQGLVLLEQAQANGSQTLHTLTAYAASSGVQRWSIALAGVTAYSPALFQSANGTVGVLSVQQDAGTALHTWSWLRVLLFLLAGLSIVLLFLLWMLPINGWERRSRAAFRWLARWPLALWAAARRLWRSSRLAVACGFALILLVAGLLAAAWINRPQLSLTQVEANHGQAQWQHALDAPVALGGADSQGSVVIRQSQSSTEGATLSTLSALNIDGTTRWSSFASEGTFSLPTVSIKPGTVLVVLSGQVQPHFTAAPDDIAYAHPLDSLYTLYLYDRVTGHLIWQSTVVSGNASQQTVVLGADAHYIYLASRSEPLSAPGQQPSVVQLIAVDQTTGFVAWRVFGPREEGTAAPDYGALLSQGRLLYWQVASTVIALDTQLGQIQWRRYIAEQNPTMAEESQMTLNAGVLLVTRSDQYHALDPITGNQQWTLDTPGSSVPQTAGGVVAVGHEFILYGNGAIEAIDASTRSIIWQHTDLTSVSDVMASPDGSLIYAVVLDNIDGGTPRQSLIAFDTSDSAVRWTFQPSTQASFLFSGAPAMRDARGMLFVTLCFSSNASSCDSQALYGINDATGTASWAIDASQVGQVQVSQDGSVIVFQANSSPWENFKARFQG